MEVWGVLSDGWLDPARVVGASRVREVKDEWPTEGSRLHDSLGMWPLRAVTLRRRNVETLRRLAYVAERRASERTSISPPTLTEEIP